MNTLPDQDPSWSAFRPAAPVPLMFEDARTADPVPPRPPVLIPDGPLGRQRLRLLHALDQLTELRADEALEWECRALAQIIYGAYGEWVAAGKPPTAQ